MGAVATCPRKMQVLALPREFAQDAMLAAEGKVSPWLVWDKHPAGVFMLGALLLMLVLWLGRLFRRPRDDAPPAEGVA